jgi:hypothetical protein
MTDSTRRVIRTTVEVLIALAAALPVLVAEAGLDVARWPWLAVVLAVAAAITRIMASPVTERLCRRFIPWLAAGSDDPPDPAAAYFPRFR